MPLLAIAPILSVNVLTKTWCDAVSPFRCRESRPYHEEPRLKTSFYPFLPALTSLFLHCSPMVTLTSLLALSLQHTVLWKKKKKKKKKKKDALLGTPEIIYVAYNKTNFSVNGQNC